uniref:Uncharacterized protein n=1 Tax=Strigamia maritima TaxID=126957 RepID=T1ITU2_STRMM
MIDFFNSKKMFTLFYCCSIILYFNFNPGGMIKSPTSITTIEVLNIRDIYTFSTPQLCVNCTCNCTADDKDDSQNMNPVLKKNQSCSIIYRETNKDKDKDKDKDNDFCSTICHINVEPNENTKPLTAIKLSQNPKLVTNQFKLEIDSKQFTLQVPRGIVKLIIDDDTLVSIEEENSIFNPLSGYDWFYVDDQLKNLRTTDFINQLNEFNLKKLGWFRRSPTEPADYTCSQTEILQNFKLLRHNCKYSTFQPHLDAAHYYNHNKLLQKEIVSHSIQQLSQIPIEDVVINLHRKIVTITYQKPLSQQIRMSPLDWKNGFSFDASISLDRFANRILSLTINENVIDQVVVEIGEPRRSVYTITIHHNGQAKKYKNRLSAKIMGDQWLCVYPLKNTSRETCRHVIYKHHQFALPENFKRIDKEDEFGFESFSANPEDFYETKYKYI